MEPAPAPFAKAVEEFILETSRKEDKSSKFYSEVLSEVNSGTVRRDSLEESKRCAQRLSEFIDGLQQKHQRDSTVRRVGERLQPLLSGLNQYTNVFDVLIQAGPSGAVLLYGGARLILQMALSLNGLFETVVSILEDVGCDLQCYHIISTAYRSSTEVQDLLVQSFKHIVRFWQDLSKLLSKKTYKIVWKSAIQPVASQWQACKETLRRDRERIAFLTQVVEADLRRQREEKNAQETAKLRREDNLNKAATWIKARLRDQDLDHRPIARSHASKRHQSTCQWLIKHQLYEDWLQGKSGAIALTGPPGIGKTVWASTIIQDLEKRGLRTICFFFSFNSPEQSDPMMALRSLALSLLRYYDYLPNRVQELFDSDMNDRFVELHDLETATKLVRALLKHIGRVHIVIDGLDECAVAKQSGLISTVNQLLIPEPFGGIVKWFFTTQPRPNIQRCLEESNVRLLEVTDEDLMDDVRLYVTDTLQTRLQSSCPGCVTDLVVKSEGNFQWTSCTLLIMEGEGLTCEEEIEEALEKCPGGLVSCYKRCLEHLTGRSKSERELARKIFTVLAATEQPLQLSEMAQALAMLGPSQEKPKELNIKRIPRRALIKELCSGLIVLDETKSGSDDPVLRFAHKSVQDFFVDNPTDLDLPSALETFFIPFETAKEQFGLACVRYLSLDRYRQPEDVTKLIVDPNHAFLKHAAIFWYKYLKDATPSDALLLAIAEFVYGPTFWNCVAIQSLIAPHLFGRYVHDLQDTYKLVAFSPEKDALADIHYAVPLPPWLSDYNSTGEEMCKQFYSFVKQWHPVLNTHASAIKQCVMDQEWGTSYKNRGSWCCDRATHYSLQHDISSDRKISQLGTTHIVRIEASNDHEFAITTRRWNALNDRMEVENIQWKLDQGRSLRQNLPCQEFRTGAMESTVALALMTFPNSAAGPDGTESKKLTLETSLGTLEVNIGSQYHQFLPLRGSNDPWKLQTCPKSDGALEAGQQSGVAVMYGTSSDSGNNDSLDESDLEASDSESEHLSLYSCDDTDEATSSTNASSKPTPNRCVILVSPTKVHVWSNWHWKFHAGNSICAVQPSGNFAIWSPSPYEACIADLATNEVKSISLPEPAGHSWKTRSSVHKEFHFSEAGDTLFYLLHTAEADESGLQHKLSAASYSISSTAGEQTLTQLGSVASVECFSVGFLLSSSAITTWTSEHVYVALPPLFCDPKVLRLKLDLLSSPRSSTISFETLRDQVYFPSSTPDRKPKLAVFPRDRHEDFVLGLDAEITAGTSSNTAQSLPQPPSLLHWRLEHDNSWRNWDLGTDTKSAEYENAKDTYYRLRGGYVDANQPFTVPVRSGWNWRKEAFLSCA